MADYRGPALEAFWRAFVDATGIDGPYTAWGFGNDAGMADALGLLVRDGPKRATTSLLSWYEGEDAEPMPAVGDLSVVLDGRDEPICVIRTVGVEVRPHRQPVRVVLAHEYVHEAGARLAAQATVSAASDVDTGGIRGDTIGSVCSRSAKLARPIHASVRIVLAYISVPGPGAHLIRKCASHRAGDVHARRVRRNAVTSVIIGARRLAQLDDNLKAIDVVLTTDDGLPNNTIYGTQMKEFPKSPVPLVCDMSSDIFSRRVNGNDFALIYAGAQKNMYLQAAQWLLLMKPNLVKRVENYYR
jgi:hypothetical protein